MGILLLVASQGAFCTAPPGVQELDWTEGQLLPTVGL